MRSPIGLLRDVQRRPVACGTTTGECEQQNDAQLVNGGTYLSDWLDASLAIMAVGSRSAVGLRREPHTLWSVEDVDVGGIRRRSDLDRVGSRAGAEALSNGRVKRPREVSVRSKVSVGNKVRAVSNQECRAFCASGAWDKLACVVY